MLDMVSQVSEVKMMPFDQAITEGWVKWIEPQRREQYIALNLSLGRRDVRPQPVRIAYTPMNGTGTTNVGKVLIEAGHTVEIFPAQSQYDGSFGGVRYRTPNPEVRQAMEDVITWAEERGADLALATDPDADRIGLAAPDANGRWRFFAGNEIASLLTYYRLQSLSERGQLPHKPLVVKTEVTTNLMHKIAESFGAVCLGELLVGFKYIAAALHQWDIGETYLGISGKSADFIIGCEESHGVLLSADVRDKDAAGAALLLAELASELKAKKQNFVDYLQQIYRKYGYHANQLSSMVMEGAVGLESIRRMQAVLREDPPKTIGNIKVLHFIDHWDENGRFGRVQSETDRSSRNVLVFELDNDARVILRPSGTEPKTKLYVEVHSTPADDQEPFDDVIAKADVQAQMLLDVFTKEVLMRIGIDVPMFALRCSDLLSIDNKLRFAKILSAWLEQLTNRDPQTLTQDPDADRTWLLPQLQAINPNPRGLLDAGFKLFLSDLKQQAQIPSHILDQMSKIWQDLP
jgi:phosphoglucomutase/phosphomannomutase